MRQKARIAVERPSGLSCEKRQALKISPFSVSYIAHGKPFFVFFWVLAAMLYSRKSSEHEEKSLLCTHEQPLRRAVLFFVFWHATHDNLHIHLFLTERDSMKTKKIPLHPWRLRSRVTFQENCPFYFLFLGMKQRRERVYPRNVPVFFLVNNNCQSTLCSNSSSKDSLKNKKNTAWWHCPREVFRIERK